MVDGIARGSLAGQPARSAGLAGRLRPAGRFVGHYVEMVAAMIVGMVVLGIPVDAVARSQGYDDLYQQLPELGTIVMTAIMTGPMALWMAVRGHDRRMIGEMSLAMVAPAVGLIAATRLELLAGSSIAMLVDPLMYVAMLAVMVARWRMYAGLVDGHDHR